MKKKKKKKKKKTAAEAYLKPCQTYDGAFFARIANG